MPVSKGICSDKGTVLLLKLIGLKINLLKTASCTIYLYLHQDEIGEIHNSGLVSVIQKKISFKFVWTRPCFPDALQCIG